MKIFYVTASIKLVFDVIEVMLGHQLSIDVRGWWPLALLFAFGVSLAYSAVFDVISRRRNVGLLYVLLFNCTYGSAHLLYVFFYYTHRIDWLAVNSVKSRLTRFEQFLHFDGSIWAFPVAALLLHSLIVQFALPRRRSQR